MDESPDARDFNEILRQILEVAPMLHSAGTFAARTLEAIADAARQKEIGHSAETGSGVSTLLFSHLSKQHTVFAVDEGSGSIRNIQRSPLLGSRVVTFVEGPTQRTLPRYEFTERLQLVLIDGPHGYPFPDLEYYFLYPHLEPGGLLILDDIQIRTVHHLFEFLRKDAMFQLDRVVETTAFFTRTDAPTFDPFGDGWWEQKYNAKALLRYSWKERIRSVVPGEVRLSLSRRWGGRSANCAVEIGSPASSATVEETGIVEGSAAMSAGTYLWVLARRKDFNGWWPQGAGAVSVADGRWSVGVTYGGPEDKGHEFEIAALAVSAPTHELWSDWVARVRETGMFPPVQLPSRQFIAGGAYRTVRKSGVR